MADDMASGVTGYECAAEADYRLRQFERALDEERAIRCEDGCLWFDDGIDAEVGEVLREMRTRADLALADEVMGTDDGWGWR